MSSTYLLINRKLKLYIYGLNRNFWGYKGPIGDKGEFVSDFLIKCSNYSDGIIEIKDTNNFCVLDLEGDGYREYDGVNLDSTKIPIISMIVTEDEGDK